MFCATAYSGSWHSHLSYYQIIAIAQSDQQVFAANASGLFSYSQTDKSFTTLSRVEGLSDSGISSIAWSASKKGLLVGYSNGNLDLLYNDKVFNLPYIKNKTSIQEKSINNIYCDGDFAWLSCEFGIVKINVKKWEVAETWIIGPLASMIQVNELTSDANYFWAATANGIYKAEKNNPNLQDFKNWQLQDQPMISGKQFVSIATFSGKVYSCDTNGRCYSFDGTTWQFPFPAITDLKKIRAFTSDLLLLCQNSLKVINNNGLQSFTGYDALLPASVKINPSDALISISSGELWVGDQKYGLYERIKNQNFALVVPSSPANNNAQSLTTSGGNLYVATGIPGSAIPAEIHRLTENHWTSINELNENKLAGIQTVLKIIPSPDDPEHYFASTYSGGLLEFSGPKLSKQYNSTNSTLETKNGLCQTYGLAFDSQGILWVTNPLANNQLHILKKDGTWKSLSYPGINNSYTSSGDLVITKNDTKWIIINNAELFALKTKNTPDNQSDDLFKKIAVQSRFTNSETTIIKGFSHINTLAEDQDGSLWVGTENGVVVYTNPEAVFGTGSFYAMQPSVELGDGKFHAVLENETVTCLAVDGGNRKWFGTDNSGVFLFSPDGTKLISQFNTDNSPLFSNNIKSIAINGQNGEVFFSTQNGLISWSGDATTGKDSFHNLYVWPNPVRETYQGEITIDGLVENSNVKITDVVGNLVYKTTSIGGRATWDGKTRSGTRVSTGVYLIFCSDSQGSQSKVIKLLFIR